MQGSVREDLPDERFSDLGMLLEICAGVAQRIGSAVQVKCGVQLIQSLTDCPSVDRLFAERFKEDELTLRSPSFQVIAKFPKHGEVEPDGGLCAEDQRHVLPGRFY